MSFEVSSGKWGDSQLNWMEELDTPINADIVCFSLYEDSFYHLQADFQSNIMQDFTELAFA